MCLELKLDVHHVALHQPALAVPSDSSWARSKKQIEFSESARVTNAKSRAALPDAQNQAIRPCCISLDGAQTGPRRIEPDPLRSVDSESWEACGPQFIIGGMKDDRAGEGNSFRRMIPNLGSCSVFTHSSVPSSARLSSQVTLSERSIHANSTPSASARCRPSQHSSTLIVDASAFGSANMARSIGGITVRKT